MLLELDVKLSWGYVLMCNSASECVVKILRITLFIVSLCRVFLFSNIAWPKAHNFHSTVSLTHKSMESHPHSNTSRLVCVCVWWTRESARERRLCPKADWFHHLSLLCPVISLCNSDKCHTMGRGWALTNCSRHSQFTLPRYSCWVLLLFTTFLTSLRSRVFQRDLIFPATWRKLHIFQLVLGRMAALKHWSVSPV